MKNLYDGSYGMINVLNLISGKWKLPILSVLVSGDLRYNVLKRKICGITNIMLTRSLKELEAHGIVSRIQYSEIPPHVEYGLTAQGQKMIPALNAMKMWAEMQAEYEMERQETEGYE